MILLDGQLNGKPAVVVLDTGANNSVVDLRAAGFALAGKQWQSGHRRVHDLVDRLEQCGVCAEVESELRGSERR
jgi:hypothetical protein